MSERKKLAIIDGKSVFYRGYYAMPNLSTKDGTPTGGVYGFAALALELMKKLKPDYVCVAWDKPKTNIRKRLEMYPAYKAGRKPAPADFYEQIPILYELLEACSWPLYELDDYEADDILCTLAKKADAAGLETMLITSDLDALQCLSETTHVYALKKGFSNIDKFDPASFEAKYGIRTDQFLDLNALKGDSSDNIPGVPGIGEKTAVQLLQQYETLEGVYDNLWQLKGAVSKKLQDGKDMAYLSKRLALLMDDAPVPLDLPAMDIKDLDVHALKEILLRLEFRSLLRHLPDYMQVAEGDTAVTPASGGDSPAARTNSWIEPLKVTLVQTATLDQIVLGNEFVLQVYTKGAHGKEPVWLLLGTASEAYLVDASKVTGKLREQLTSILQSNSCIGFDLKASFQALLELQLPLPRAAHDVSVGSFLIDSLRREKTLTELVTADVGYEGSAFESIDSEEWQAKAGEIAAYVRALYRYQAESISELTDVIKLSDQVEWPVISVLARMEYYGISLDVPYLSAMSKDFDDTISDLVQQIYGFADQEFNVSSPSQLADILYDKLGLPTAGVKKGKTGYSTAADELAKLQGLHPIIELISQYREVTKLKSTYVDALPKLIDATSRVHTTFNLTTAQTGRLSSLDPNLQNIPVRTELGKKIRQAFEAAPGHVFVSADYSQFELRIAAALSKDQDMITAFNDDADIHALTAAAVMGIPVEQVTKEMRYRAKAVNFGILYGQGPHGLATATGMTFGEAKSFIERYFQIRPKLKAYIEQLREQAKTKGFVATLLGRRRPTPDVTSSNFAVREAAYRQAVNMPIQGTAADLTKLAMVRLDQSFAQEYGTMDGRDYTGPRQILQIHDSIMVECTNGQVERVSGLMKEVMESVCPELGIKLRVDIASGRKWGDL